MAVNLAEPFGLEIGDSELEELVSAGDNNAWSMDDWTWDSKNFTATPAAGTEGRASKRQCMGLSHMGIEGLLETGNACCGGKPADAAGPGLVAAESACTSPKNSIGSASPPPDGVKPQGPAPCCQVEGCGKDLGGLSTYHQRCRICEIHIKEPRFLRAGLVQRFCQQCGRCHELSAFQGDRRSCKDQLAKHNARRRRRQKKDGAEQEPETPSQATPCQAGLISALATLGSWLGQAQNAPPNPSPYAMQLPGSFPAQQSAPQPWGNPNMSASMVPVGVATSRGEGIALGQPVETRNGPGQESLCYPEMTAPQVSAAAGFAVEGHHFGTMEYGAVPQGWEGRGQTAMSHIPQEAPPASGGPEYKNGTTDAADSFETALAMMTPSGPEPPTPPQYRSDNLVVRLSVKLFNCTPAQLPAELKQQLTGWLNCTPVGAEGYLRPGCVHLVMQAVVTADQARQIDAGGVRAVVAHLAAQRHPVWRDHVHLVELNGQVAVVRDGRLLSVVDLSASGGGFAAPPQAPHETSKDASLAASPLSSIPQSEVAVAKSGGGQGRFALRPSVQAIRPAAVFCGGWSGVPFKVQLEGVGCLAGDCKVLCRTEGRYAKLECTAVAAHGGWEVELPAGLRPGLVWLEVQRGCLLSPPRHLLLCPSQALARELAPAASAAGSGDLTLDVGLLLAAKHQTGAAGLAPVASRLVKHACQADMPELLTFVLSLYPCLLEAPAGMSPQHVCVQNGSLAALQALLAHPGVQANPAGPKGITPLHLAALQDGSAALTLLEHCPQDEWTGSLTQDGFSPRDFARKAGNHGLAQRVSAHAAAAIPTPPGSFWLAETAGGGKTDAAVAKFGTSPTTSGSSKESGFCLAAGRFGSSVKLCDVECVPGPNTVSDSETGGSDSECELWVE